MKIKFYRTIWWKLALTFVVIIFFTIIAIFAGIREATRRVGQAYLKNSLISQTRALALSASENLYTGGEPAEVQVPLLKAATLPGSSLFILDVDGKVLSRSQRVPVPDLDLDPEKLERLSKGHTVYYQSAGVRPAQRYIFSASPLFVRGNYSGAVMLVLAPQPEDLRREYARTFINTILLTALIFSVVAFFIARGITRPVSRLESAARQVARGDFSASVETRRRDEIGALARSFARMSKRLQKNIEGRLRMTADVSHELRTPLSSIRGCTEAIQDGILKDREEENRYLDTILAQTRRLEILIDDLTELSRFETGEIKVKQEQFSPGDVLTAIYRTTIPLARSKGIEIVTDPPDPGLVAVGDRDRIQQAMTNLLNNAITHTPRGTTITIGARRKYRDVHFYVRDDGPGIPEDEQEDVFERFVKLDRSRSSKGGGSGLGLAIVREIIAAHGSRVYVKSRGKGCTFYFDLPLADVNDSRVSEA